MPRDFAQWGFLVLVILIATPVIFWLITLFIAWVKWLFKDESKRGVSYAKLKDFENPVSNVIKIDFEVGTDSEIKISLLDKNFNLLIVLLEESLERGEHSLDLDTVDYVDGEYFAQLKTNHQRITKKVIFDNQVAS